MSAIDNPPDDNGAECSNGNVVPLPPIQPHPLSSRAAAPAESPAAELSKSRKSSSSSEPATAASPTPPPAPTPSPCPQVPEVVHDTVWQLGVLGDAAANLCCINARSDVNSADLASLGFGEVLSRSSHTLDEWRSKKWSETNLYAIILLVSMDGVVEVQENEEVCLGNDGDTLMKFVKALQNDTIPPIFVVLSGVPAWPGSLGTPSPPTDGDQTLITAALGLHDFLLQAGVHDVMIVEDGQRLLPWRIVSATARSVVVADKEHQAEKQFMWNLAGSVFPNIPKQTKSIKETPGRAASNREGGSVGEYSFERMLGQGSFGAVYLAKGPERFGGKVAIKEIPKTIVKHPGSLASLDREFCIMRNMMPHPNVVHAREVLHTSSSFYVVMTYAGSMSLTAYMKKFREDKRRTNSKVKGPSETRTIAALPQEVSEQFMWQASAALAHLHKWQVCHRDVKPDNLIISNDNDELHLSLTDFGLATMVCGTNQTLHDCVGTIPFVAPEILWDENGRQGYNGFQADAWSLAVTFVDLVWGYRQIEQSLGWLPKAPEKSDKKAIALRKLPELWSTKPCPASYATVTPVVAGLLKVDPSARWTLAEAERYASSLGELQQRSSLLVSFASMPPGSQNLLNPVSTAEKDFGMQMGPWHHFRQEGVIDRNHNLAATCPAVMMPTAHGRDLEDLLKKVICPKGPSL
eukprot:gnl/TRDRNA2_/TRDRNA2_177831_c0_seq8.p1 gnl/TRDRNA2_/TRDRNA2_177831_c0~~gnl/TRDRNA2_/TRDRNA2_177831_c0_seq8.p1  ORF type:complete len:691 (-),score=80.74 gnl/TRDRNA2_/TRDRNA2_177831_c0_seq8:1039-3111(-)